MVDRSRWPIPEVPLGADLTGRHVIVMGEQGLGEELFSLRFAKTLKDRDARLTACVDRRLVPMLCQVALQPRAAHVPIREPVAAAEVQSKGGIEDSLQLLQLFAQLDPSIS